MTNDESTTKAREAKAKKYADTKSSVALTGHAMAKKNRLQRLILANLLEDWEEHGQQALADGRAKDPLGYVKMMATMIPKEQVVKKPKDIDEDKLLAAMRGVEADERSKTDDSEMEERSRSIRQGGPASKALRTLAGESAEGDSN